MLNFDELIRLLNIDADIIDENMREEIVTSQEEFFSAIEFYETGNEYSVNVLEGGVFNSDNDRCDNNNIVELLGQCGAEKIFAGACTLGTKVDELIAKANNNCDFIKIMVFDTLANFVVSDFHCKAMDKIKSEYLQLGLHLTREFAPGTNVPLSLQKGLFELIKAEKISLTPDLLMYPKKSLSYIFGLTAKTQGDNLARHDCSACHAKNCRSRKDRESRRRLTVHYGNHKEYIDVITGTNLLKALRANGYDISAPCGGNGACGKCKIIILDTDCNQNSKTDDGGKANVSSAERKLLTKEELNAGVRLACHHDIMVDMEVSILVRKKDIYIAGDLPYTQKFDINGSCSLVADVGTTTVALALMDEKTGETVDIVSANNPQSRFGGDVITRIEYARGGGAEELSSEIVACINKLTDALVTKYGEFIADKLLVSANTTMLHLLFSRDCSGMAGYPYTPNFLGRLSVSAAEMGINRVKTVESLEGLSAFVGADIMSGVYYLGEPSEGKWKLLVDLGTNAEIALFSREKMYCTAAASGPAFEGANISSGMSASEGAICEVSVEGCKLVCSTIGATTACGVCGTGLVDAVCSLVSLGIVSEDGAMETDEYHLTDNITLTQKDIREFQVAKSAVRSGIDLLIEKYEISPEQIESVCISGGFAKNINIDNAVRCGLLPKTLASKTFAVGNSSLAGAIIASTKKETYEAIVSRGEYVDMACDPSFFDRFIDNLSLAVGDFFEYK